MGCQLAVSVARGCFGLVPSQEMVCRCLGSTAVMVPGVTGDGLFSLESQRGRRNCGPRGGDAGWVEARDWRFLASGVRVMCLVAAYMYTPARGILTPACASRILQSQYMEQARRGRESFIKKSKASTCSAVRVLPCSPTDLPTPRLDPRGVVACCHGRLKVFPPLGSAANQHHRAPQCRDSTTYMGRNLGQAPADES